MIEPVRIMKTYTLLLFSLLLLCLTIPLCAQEQATDSLGTQYQLIEGGRFIQGMSGGERELEQAFPLSTAGQFYGERRRPSTRHLDHEAILYCGNRSHGCPVSGVRESNRLRNDGPAWRDADGRLGANTGGQTTLPVA